jgi:hypothetical protein
VSNTETVCLSFAAWEGSDNVEWECEVTIHRDGDAVGRAVLVAQGSGDVDGDVLVHCMAAFERFSVAVARSKGVVVELPLGGSEPHRAT